ncbi:aggregation-promoting factor [Streptococcus panodentis]|uniref:Peptidoglycan-binding protein LysM n=1 Tax=Streptococcus panodentis TaxID=1581472 RepID=A0ABS5AUK7_9STRE|nr:MULTISPECIES: LysM peptidoglycan-binding domain-containing protein [Streptococcus]KXT84990.1 Aggregation promoting factor [Streptococcus sp. DD11]MBP2620255.1 peptidoglycan-binding protein LysM [Streptococcus panodentis]
MNAHLKKKKLIKGGLFSLAAGAAFLLPNAVSADSYTVKSGDTLSAIASSHHTTVDAIAAKNKLSDINLIAVGQVLELDSAETAAAPAAETPTATAASEMGSSAADASSGLNAQDAEAKEWIAQKESGGSYTAQNGQYYGRYQLTITYLNGDLSEANQEKAANEYVVNRYGSWTAAKDFWLANGWY